MDRLPRAILQRHPTRAERTDKKVDGGLLICVKHRVVIEPPDVLEKISRVGTPLSTCFRTTVGLYLIDKGTTSVLPRKCCLSAYSSPADSAKLTVAMVMVHL